MKLLILCTLLLASQVNAYELKLKFASKRDAKAWVVWYLDGGGEQVSDYYANTWNIENLMANDGRYKRPYLYLVKDKEMIMNGQQEGVVKFFNQSKGFGFITKSDSVDIFFHITEWQGQGEPNENDKVSFAEGEGKKGPVAEGVQLLN